MTDGYSTMSSKTCGKCGDIYNNVYAEHTCPSFCNFNAPYTTLQNMYAPSTIYIPPDEAARLYNYPIGVSSNYMVAQPQIVNWNMDTQFNNISGMPVSQDPKEVLGQVQNALNTITSNMGQLEALVQEANSIAVSFRNASAENKLELVKRVLTIEEKGKMLMGDVIQKFQFINASATNVAPYTVRDAAMQDGINRTLEAIKNSKNTAQSMYYKIRTTTANLKDMAKPIVNAFNTPQSLNLTQSKPAYSAIMSPNASMGQSIPSDVKIRRV